MDFVEGEASIRVEACGVALVCKISWPLLRLVFTRRELEVEAPVTIDNTTTLRIGW